MKPGVYIIGHPISDNMYKIGCSISMETRIYAGDTFNPEGYRFKPIAFIHAPAYCTKDGVKLLEQIFHAQLDKFRNKKQREICYFQTINGIRYPERVGEEKLCDFSRRKPREFFKFDTVCLLFTELNSIFEYLRSEYSINCGGWDNIESVPDKDISIRYLQNEYFNESIKQFDMPTQNAMKKLTISYEYQNEILTKMTDHFMHNSCGKLILPCGYGKSYIASNWINRSHAKRIIVLTPFIDLTRQFAKVLEEVTHESVVVFDSQDNTNVSVLKELFSRECYILAITYQSMNSHRMELDTILAGNPPNIIIYDESHHTCTKEDGMFSSSISIPAEKRLFMTATPKIVEIKTISDSSSELDHDDAIVYSMNNESIYGQEIINVNFTDAIEKGLLCDYRLFISTSPDAIGIVRELLNLGRKRIVLFFNRCEHARNAQMLLQEHYTDIQTHYLDGSSTKTDRAQVFGTFEYDSEDVQILCNVSIISEGISIPIIDSIAFVEPTDSSIGLMQKIGRGLRLYDGKGECIIVLHGDMADSMKVFNTLYRYDKRISNPDRIMCSRAIRQSVLEHVAYEVRLIEIDKMGGAWEYKLALCKAYEKETNEVVTRSKIYCNIPIGEWFHNVVNLHKLNPYKLSVNRLELLNTLKSWTDQQNKLNYSKEEIWQIKLKLCIEFESKSQDLIDNTTCYNGIDPATNIEGCLNIGRWLDTQRQQYVKKKISDQRLELLNSLQSWIEYLKLARKPIKTFEEWFGLCIKYETEINPIIIASAKYNTDNIGQWIGVMKQKYKKKELNSDENQMLNKLKTWTKWITEDREYVWNNNLQLCIDFESKNIINITKTTKHENNNIGQWLHNVKTVYNRTKSISEERKNSLARLRTWHTWFPSEK